MDLRNFTYRREKIRATEIFPQFNIQEALELLDPSTSSNPHQTILDTVLSLWEGGYDSFFKAFGFYDREFAMFSGHCHQYRQHLDLY